MQLITLISAASALVATASANAVILNKACDTNAAYARIINRCDYKVHLWSVFKGTGCPTDEMVTLEKGEIYNENYQNPVDGVGISIKISKTESCKANDIVQFEYYLEKTNKAYEANYLDMSYVDCGGDDCPTKNEGYYLVAGNQTGGATASAGNTWCPILACNDAASCAKISYINPDDTQTKTCDLSSNTDLYLCGGEAPTDEYDSAPAPAASSEEATSAAPEPTSTSVEDSYTEEYKVAAAAVTPAPEVKAVEGQKTRTKVHVVYVTATEYVNAKRHAHGHARRHQPFQA